MILRKYVENAACFFFKIFEALVWIFLVKVQLKSHLVIPFF